MSEQEADIREAAAAGAAAAVEAITEEQHEDERRDAMESATAVASESASVATEYAEDAAEAATAASVAASEALAEADTASAEASAASAEANEARSEVSELRETLSAGFTELRRFIADSLAPKSDEQPTEVVVSHASEERQDSGRAHTDRDRRQADGSEAPRSAPRRAYGRNSARDR